MNALTKSLKMLAALLLAITTVNAQSPTLQETTEWIKDNVSFATPALAEGNSDKVSKVSVTFDRCVLSYKETRTAARDSSSQFDKLEWEQGFTFSLSDIDPLSISRSSRVEFEFSAKSETGEEFIALGGDTVSANISSARPKIRAYLKYIEISLKKGIKKSSIDWGIYQPKSKDEKQVVFRFVGKEVKLNLSERFELAFRSAVKLCGGKVDPY